MADDQSMSKRERQKARRQERLEAERAAARSERTKKTVATFAVVIVVVGALGAWGFNTFTDWQDRRQAIEEARANLEQYGCTEVEEQPIMDSAHLSGAELASSPPDALYPDRPTTSGRHLGNVAQTGVFDKVVDERLLVHNLEHGYVNIFVSEDADDEQWQEVSDFVEGEIGSGTEKLIASRWKADMPGEGNIAFTAWGARQVCEEWNRGVALAFISEWHYLDGNAPERTVQPHRGGPRGGGGVDPEESEGDLLFPPLGEVEDADLEEDIMETPEGNVEEGEDGSGDDAGAEDAPADEPTEG